MWPICKSRAGQGRERKAIRTGSMSRHQHLPKLLRESISSDCLKRTNNLMIYSGDAEQCRPWTQENTARANERAGRGRSKAACRTEGLNSACGLKGRCEREASAILALPSQPPLTADSSL